MSRMLSVAGVCLAVVAAACSVEESATPGAPLEREPAHEAAGASASHAPAQRSSSELAQQQVEPTNCYSHTATRMPVRARGQAVVEIDGEFYVFGGLSEAESLALGPQRTSTPNADTLAGFYSSVRAYDPQRAEWTTKTNLPIGLFDLKANRLGDKVYVFGGYNGNGFESAVQAYDPATDTWTQHAAMPTRRYIFTSEVVAGKAYLIGGHGPTDGDADAWQHFNTVEIFDPEEGWARGAPAPYAIAGAASCSLDERIFVFGGDLGNKTSVYNVSSNSWSTAAPPPTARNAHQCVRVENLFYLIGGRDGTSSVDLVEIYDPEADAWRTDGHISTPRQWFGAAALDDKIYVFGGEREPQDPVHHALLDDVQEISTASRHCGTALSAQQR